MSWLTLINPDRVKGGLDFELTFFTHFSIKRKKINISQEITSSVHPFSLNLYNGLMTALIIACAHCLSHFPPSQPPLN